MPITFCQIRKYVLFLSFILMLPFGCATEELENEEVDDTGQTPISQQPPSETPEPNPEPNPNPTPTPEPEPEPETPPSLVSMNVNANSYDLDLEWQATNASLMEIQRTTDGVEWTVLAVVENSQTQFSDQHIYLGTPYQYRMRASDGSESTRFSYSNWMSADGDGEFRDEMRGIYGASCAQCHGDNGEGGRGFPAINNEVLFSALVSDVSRMPLGGSLDCDGIPDCEYHLSDFIRSEFYPNTEVPEPPEPPESPEPVDAFSCNATDPISVTPMQRLTKVQYQNTLQSLLDSWFDADVSAGLYANLVADIAQIPDDEADENFSNHDNRVTEFHVDGYVDVAYTLATSIAGQMTRLVELAQSNCVWNTNDVSCYYHVVDRVGPQILRRPLTDEDREFYASIGNYTEIIATLLMSPDFLYHTEFVGELNGDVLALDSYAIVNRLAYHFWQSMPDEYLFEAAANDQPVSDFEAVLDYVVNDPKSREGQRHFYRGWLGLDHLAEFSETNTTAFRNFVSSDYSGNRNVDISSDADFVAYRQDALDSFDHFVDYFTWQVSGTFEDLFTSSVGFVTNEDLATATGISVWSGSYSDTPTFPEDQRGGVLTHPALQMYGAERTRPILNGVRVLNHVMCEDLPPPDNNDTPDGVVILPEYTTRERVTAITDHPGTPCIGCHQIINPYGFAFESYDAIGRYRNEEIIFDDDGNEFIRGVVDASGTSTIDGAAVSFENAVSLSDAIAQSNDATACFSKHYFRFMHRRDENESADGCSLQPAHQVLTEGGSLLDMFRAMAEAEAFVQRRLPSVEE